MGVFTKCVPNDWQYKYPPHPLLGKFPERRKVMEIDLYNETGGNIHSILLAPEYYRTQIQMARELGLAGVIQGSTTPTAPLGEAPGSSISSFTTA